MHRPGALKEFARIAMQHGHAAYTLNDLLALVGRQQRSLRNLRKEEPLAKRVSADALEVLREHILQTRQKIWADSRSSKVLGKEVERLKRALEKQTRQLVAE